MPLQFAVSAEIPATRQAIYNAWLNSDGHAAMTGADATAGNNIGDAFTAHDGYISGKNMELVPFTKIVQTWRTTEFEEGEEDSILEVTLADKDGNTMVTLNHCNLPPHGNQYYQGWIDYYFEPMKEYFSANR